ncbi:MAG TPA: M56 family metallopeptidase [Candidatus Sulfotelmatobacter sp.]|nr:M56 family metallopeptidase [Candidatus Sulfotelmatobacter sp.]
MFLVRGMAVSFSVFVMVYCALSLAVGLGWHKVWLYSQRRPVRRIADFLFALRMFPLITAAVITAAFTVPSFLLLEPRAINEPLGEIPLALGLGGALLGIFGLGNAALAARRASRTISEWTRAAQPVESGAAVPVLRISRTVPAMTATGIVRPRVLLSGAAESMLTAGELRTALNHEVAHVRRRDNLRKLLMRFVAFPGMRGLEAAWFEATEMAADDAAVSNAGEALDLAAALIKLSRLGPVEPPVDLTAALVHSPASVMNARVERLITWNDERRVPPAKYSPWYGLSAALVAVAAFAVTYSQLLVHVHTATEWLVR